MTSHSVLTCILLTSSPVRLLATATYYVSEQLGGGLFMGHTLPDLFDLVFIVSMVRVMTIEEVEL